MRLPPYANQPPEPSLGARHPTQAKLTIGNLAGFHSASWRESIRQLGKQGRLRIIRLYDVRWRIHAIWEIGRDAEVVQLLIIHHRIYLGEHLLKPAILVYAVFAKMIARPRDAEGLAVSMASVACAGHFLIPMSFSVSTSSGTDSEPKSAF